MGVVLGGAVGAWWYGIVDVDANPPPAQPRKASGDERGLPFRLIAYDGESRQRTIRYAD
jgi:hypothetical protein